MSMIPKLIVVGALLTQLAHAQGGRVSIQTSPRECRVYIDSIALGETPLIDIALPPGPHLIRIAPPRGGAWNYEDKEIEIFVKDEWDTTLNVTFSRPVFINSIPFGAHLKTRDEHLGITPLYLPFESYKDYSLQIIKDGYEPYSFVLREPQPIIARLVKKEGYVEAEKQKPQLFGVLPKQHVKSKFALLALTVTTHWASFYFKNVADDKYQAYLHTADPQLIDKYWKETRRYDRLSDITLGVSYAALAGLIYMVIWH